jgi:hypothetical protein
VEEAATITFFTKVIICIILFSWIAGAIICERGYKRFLQKEDIEKGYEHVRT